MKKEKIKKIAFSLAEAMISMLIISAIAVMSIKLFAGQKTKTAADMAHHIMGCYMLENGGIAAMSMEIGKPETLQIEGFSAPNGEGFVTRNGVTQTSSQAGFGIGNIKLHYADWMFEGATSEFPFGASALPNSTGHTGPFCAIDVNETLGSTARTLAMIGGGGFGFMSPTAQGAEYNRPGDTGFFATYTNVDFARPGVYRFYPGKGAPVIGTNQRGQAIGDESNIQGGPSKVVFVPTKRNTQGDIEEIPGTNNQNIETLAEARGGYSRGHYYPLGPIQLSDIGCDDYQSCRFESTQFKIAKQTLTEVANTYCGGNQSDTTCMSQVTAQSKNWATYTNAGQFLSAQSYKNYVTKVMPDANGDDQIVDYFAGKNGADAFNDYYKGGTMLATPAGNQITIGMNDLTPRCTNEMHNFLKITANSGTPTIFTGTAADSFLYMFGTGGACSNYHNSAPGNNGMPGRGGALFLIW